MCGRFAFYSAHEAMPAMFGLAEGVGVEASYNIAPTDNAAVIRLTDTGEKRASMLRWGLIPFWSKDPSIGNRLINARSETARSKPSFRAAFKRRRCLIPADGFYEWRAESSGKQPYYIAARSAEPFTFAGLWESWSAPDDESETVLETFTILTRSANGYLTGLHQRMPVILTGDDADRWLDSRLPPDNDEVRFPETPDRFLVASPVEKTVSNPRNDGPGLIVAIGEAL